MLPGLRWVLCAGSLALAALVCPDGAQAQTFDPDVYYQLRARHSGKCLDIPFASMANGTALQQWDCNPAPQQNQLWTIVPVPSSPGVWRVTSANNAKCVDIAGASTANGALATQYDCNMAWVQTNQVFSIYASPTAGYWRLPATHTLSVPKCLDVASSSTANGAGIQQWDCGPWWNTNQDWEIVPFVARQPLTHLGTWGYFNELGPSALNGMRESINTTQNTFYNASAILPTTASAGIKGLISIMNDDDNPATPLEIFRVTWRNGVQLHTGPGQKPGLGPCSPAVPDNEYSYCETEGGLRSDWYTRYTTHLKPIINANLANIRGFYFDEPYVHMLHHGFTQVETKRMLDAVIPVLKADYPTLPIIVTNPSYHINMPYPSQVDVIGTYCYDWNAAGTALECIDDTLTPRSYAYLHTRMKAFHPGKKYVVVPNAVLSSPTPNDAPKLASLADYFINLAMADPDVTTILIWSHMAAHDPALAAVHEKYRFLGRALGFGCTNGATCPSLWP